MEPYITFKLFLLALLFFLSGFFACSEAALFSLTPLHLHKMKEEKFPYLDIIRKLLEFPRRLLITIIVSNEIVNITLSTLVAGLFIYAIGDQGKWWAIVVTTPVLLIFGEAIPKTLARANPMKFSWVISPFLSFFAFLEYPIVWVLEKISGWMLFPFKKDEGSSRRTLMEGELRTLINIGYKEGILDKSQRDLIHRVFDLEDTDAGDIMMPRVDMFCLPLGMDADHIKGEIISHGYSRVPVYDSDPDDIVGILYAKDLLTSLSNGHIGSIKDLLKKPYFIPEEKSAGSLLKDFQSRKIHLAVIIDEYGGIAGLVTMEDILERLFGDIYDERDTREHLYHVIDERTTIMRGMMPVDDFNELAGTAIPPGDYDTLGGYVLHLFGTLPVKGQSVQDDRHIYRIEKMAKARIMRIRVTRKEVVHA